MLLHEALADLARDHGHGLFRDASAFRGSLDDYLDEGQASSGTINLLTDAVRLGALDALLTMLDSGANAADAVESAGQRLARDRGSADVRGCQWAVAVLGFALGKVPEALVSGLDPEARTASPPNFGPAGTAPAAPFQSPAAPFQSPVQPPQQPIMSPAAAFPQAGPQPVASPAQQFSGGGYGAGTPAYPTWQSAEPKKRKTGVLIAAVVAVLAVLIGGVVGIVALSGDDGGSGKDDQKSTKGEKALDGPTIEGTGYTVTLPKGWSDGTEELLAKNPGLSGVDKMFLWGDSFDTARGNAIVSKESSQGVDDPSDIESTWKSNVTSGSSLAGADLTDLADTTIGGKKAVGFEAASKNNSGRDIIQRIYLVISGDAAYTVTVTMLKNDQRVGEVFSDVMENGWKWDD